MTDEVRLLELCWPRTPTLKIEPKTSSAIVNPTILANLALISPLDEFHSVLLRVKKILPE